MTVTHHVAYAGRALTIEHARADDHIARKHATGTLYEAAMIDHLRSLPEVRGRHALDVGAHVGSHALGLLAGGEVSGVTCLEPWPESYALLCRNLRGVDPLGGGWCAMQVAVGNGELVELVPPPPGNAGMTSVRVVDCGIIARRLDDLVHEGLNVGLVKVDVEGHEVAVIRGALRTLRTWRPALAVEGDAAILRAELEPLGYVLETSWNATPTHVFRHVEVVR